MKVGEEQTSSGHYRTLIRSESKLRRRKYGTLQTLVVSLWERKRERSEPLPGHENEQTEERGVDDDDPHEAKEGSLVEDRSGGEKQYD
jgi:hypothetical protein